MAVRYINMAGPVALPTAGIMPTPNEGAEDARGAGSPLKGGGAAPGSVARGGAPGGGAASDWPPQGRNGEIMPGCWAGACPLSGLVGSIIHGAPIV